MRQLKRTICGIKYVKMCAIPRIVIVEVMLKCCKRRLYIHQGHTHMHIHMCYHMSCVLIYARFDLILDEKEAQRDPPKYVLSDLSPIIYVTESN